MNKYYEGMIEDVKDNYDIEENSSLEELIITFKYLCEKNQQLKEDYSKLLETSKAYKKLLKTTMQKEHRAIKVLDEIREVIDFAKATIEYGRDYSDVGYNFLISADKIVEILDKVRE